MNTEAGTPALTISIVNWNTSDLLGSVIASVLTTQTSFELFVIDNDSSDDFASVEAAYRSDPRITFIRNERNRLLLAKNQSYECARGPYFVALGPDAILTDGALDRLYEFLESNPEAGAATADIRNPDGTLQHYYRRLMSPGVFFVWTYLGASLDRLFFHGTHVARYRYANLDLSRVSEVEQPPGDVCLMSRRAALAELLIVDQKIPFYFADADIAKRIYDRGFRIYLVPEAVVKHHKSASSKQALSSWRARQQRRGLFAYFRKHYPLMLPVVVVFYCLDAIAKRIARAMRRI